MATRRNSNNENKENTRGSKASTRGKKASRPDPIEVKSFLVKRAIECRNGAVLFDLELNGVTIYGCSIVTSERDDSEFIGFPSRKGNDGKYYSIAWAPLSDEDTADIIDAVDKKLNEE